MKSKINIGTATALAVACSAGLGLLAADLQKPLKAPPSKDFVDGFEAGVRYGFMARAAKPSIQTMPELTEEAKRLYYLIVADGGRWLIDSSGKTNLVAATNAVTKKP